MKVKSESEVAQSCPTLRDPMDCSPPGPPSMGFSRQEDWSGVVTGETVSHLFPSMEMVLVFAERVAFPWLPGLMFQLFISG